MRARTLFFTTPPATAAQAKLFALKIQMFIVSLFVMSSLFDFPVELIPSLSLKIFANHAKRISWQLRRDTAGQRPGHRHGTPHTDRGRETIPA
jgi:hypothetical protein